MRLLIGIGVVCLLLLGGTTQAQTDLPPYLYYYSDALNGIVIERADGSDSRLMWTGLMSLPVDMLVGPGWSPDGQWLSWAEVDLETYKSTVERGFVVNVDGTTRLNRLDVFRRNLYINWSPDNRYLLVRGIRYDCFSSCEVNFWILDVATQQVLASTILIPTLYPPEATSIIWDIWDRDEYSVSFYEVEDLGPVQYFYVTMYFDGRVVKQPIAREEYNSVVHLPSYETRWNLLDSPTGYFIWYPSGEEGPRFEIRGYGQPVAVPPHSDALGIALDAKWHSSEAWVILGYQRCAAGCSGVGGASVMSIDGTTVRELGNCGFGDSCIGWLPETVDLSSLPLGESQSVLPQPVDIDYDVEFQTFPGLEPYPYAITCDESLALFNQIKDMQTGEIIFTLPGETPCPSDEPYEQPIPFALNPDRSIYAMNDQYGGITELFDAQTGELLARTNSYSIELTFSEDGTQLIARSRYAMLTWDVPALIEHFAELRQNGWTP